MKFALLAFVSTVSAAIGDCATTGAAAEGTNEACTCAETNCKVCLVADVADAAPVSGSCVTCSEGFTAAAETDACAAVELLADGATCTADSECATTSKCGTYTDASEDPVVVPVARHALPLLHATVTTTS